MKYVYILQSIDCPDRFYTGMTDDLEGRLKRHNAREVPAHFEVRALAPEDLYSLL